MVKNDFAVTQHMLVPKHIKLSEKEKKELLDRYNITQKELPKINPKDPAIESLSAKEGDIIKVIRPSRTAGEAYFYRRVTSA